MSKIKFDNETIKVMSLFSEITRANLKDFLIDENELAVFIVGEGQLGKAVGKHGANALLLEKKLNRKIKIVEFNPDVLQFVQNLVYPLKLQDIKQESGIITMEAPDLKTRGFLIGRAAKNLRNAERITKRHFEITEIKVL